MRETQPPWIKAVLVASLAVSGCAGATPEATTTSPAPPRHGAAPADLALIEEAEARGEFVVEIFGDPLVLPRQMTS